MKLSLALFSAIFLLVGCASTTGLKEDRPYATYQSKKNAKDVSGCVSDAWEKEFSSTMLSVNSRHTQTGYAISVISRGWGFNNAAWLLETQDLPSGGSTSNLYKGYVVGGSNIVSAVERCN